MQENASLDVSFLKNAESRTKLSKRVLYPSVKALKRELKGQLEGKGSKEKPLRGGKSLSGLEGELKGGFEGGLKGKA